MKLLKKGEPITASSIAPLERSQAIKMVNEYYRKQILGSIDLASGRGQPRQLYGIFERADKDYLYDELSRGKVIWGLDSVLSRSEAQVQTALYFIEVFHQGRRNKTEYTINIEMKDDPRENNKVILSLRHSGTSNNESIFVQLYKQRPEPAQIPADLNKQLQDLIAKPRYTEHEGYRYHHTKQKSMGMRYSNYTIITDMNNKIIAIAGGSSVVFCDTKRPTLSFTGRNFHDDLVDRNVASYSDGSSHFSDATDDPEGFFKVLGEYLARS